MPEDAKETHALLGVHQHIDALAARSPEAAAHVARLFPCYGVGAVGWTREFERLLRDKGKIDSGESAFPTLDEGLAHLVEHEPENAWHGARRLQTLAALTRVSERHAPGGEEAEVVTRALRHHAAEEHHGKAVHHRLAEPELTHDTWHIGVRQMVASGELDEEYLDVAPPCSGDLVPVTIGNETDPVAVLSTVYHHPDFVPDDFLSTLLDPKKWPECDKFWCAMTVDGQVGTYLADATTFLEEVAGDCSGWRIVTRLDFRRRHFPDDGSYSLDYWLAADQTDPCDGLVQVDEGSILVEPTGPTGVRISTTKRLKFAGPMDGAQLAMTACALGWDGAGEQFVFGCTTASTGQQSGAKTEASTS